VRIIAQTATNIRMLEMKQVSTSWLTLDITIEQS